MNLRIVTFLNYEGELQPLKDLVSDFSQSLLKRGFENDLNTDDDTVLKSLILVKENREMVEMGANEYLASEMENAFLKVVPVLEPPEEFKSQIGPPSESADPGGM
jgi:hypothetical protein